MSWKPYINIEYPFKDDPKGKWVKMNENPEDAVKADLIHLLLTNKGERLYQPTFGANLRKYLFEPNTSDVHADIKAEIQAAVSRWIPNLQVDKLEIVPGKEGENRNEHHVLVKMDYTVTNGTFNKTSYLELVVAGE